MKGHVKKEIYGVERNFHFGTRMFELCEENGISVGDLSAHFKAKAFTTITTVVHCAALAYCELKSIEPDFKKVDISSWIDEVGLQNFMDMVTSSIKVYEPKNEEALQETK